MKDDKDTQPLSIYNRHDDLNDEPGAFNADSGTPCLVSTLERSPDSCISRLAHHHNLSPTDT